MRKDKLDEMREKLKLDSLDEKIKKDMFNKFVEAGGQVVDFNKKDKKSQKKKEELKKEKAKKERDLNLSGTGEKTQYQPRELKKSAFNPIDPQDNPINKWIERFSAKLGCYISGILSLNGEHFKSSFRELIIYQFQNVLLNSRMILASVLYQDKLVANEIKKSSFLDSVFPYNYELIYRYDNLYNPELFDQLGVLRNSQHLVRDIKSILLQIFKSILVIQPYHAYLKSAIEKALIAEKNIRGLDPAISYDNLKKLYSNVDFIFLKIYPKLFMLIDWYYKKDSIEAILNFKDYLKFNEEDVIGYYTNKWKSEIAATARKDKKENEENQFTEDKGPADISSGQISMEENDPIKKGLQIIENNIKLRTILNSFSEQHDIRSLFQLRDRVFITLCLIDFFDKEFSLLFNSNKIGLNITFVDGKRSDMKRDLLDSYYKLNNILERVNEYLKIIKEIKKMESDAFVSFQERTSRSNQYSLQRSQISRSMRKEAKEFFEEFSKKLLYLICDYQRGGKIIINPDIPLEFDKKLDGSRYADGKKPLEIIEDAYYFTCASHFLLTDGDLSPLGLILEKNLYLHLDLDQFNG